MATQTLEDLQKKVTTIYPGELFFDYFCAPSTLDRRGSILLDHLSTIIDSPRIDKSKTYVCFKNSGISMHTTQDDFRICDLETGDVIYTVTPKSMHKGRDKGLSVLHGRDNSFREPLVVGSWKDVEDFFMAEVVEEQS